MDFLNGLEIHDKDWGDGKLTVQGEKVMAYFIKKHGIKYVKIDYPLDFDRRMEIKTNDEEVLQRIAEDIWFAKAEKESLAFKYNYCDGGSSATELGFNGVCSDECIRRNIDQAGRAWCSISTSPCRAHIEGKKTRAELENDYRNNEFFCYESRLTTSWKAGIGVNNDGTPRRLGSDVRKGLAIMTTTDSAGDERNRYIFAVFFIRSQEFGDDKKEGSVCAFDGNKKVYALLLNRQEAQQMKFWDYYSNPNKPNIVRWGHGLYRFISHARSARILQDIVSLKTNPNEKKEAQVFLDMFCSVHGITKIPPRDGALTMMELLD